MHTVDGLLDFEDVFFPTHRGQRSTQPLSEQGFSAAAADDLRDRQLDRVQRFGNVDQRVRELTVDDRLRMRQKSDLEAFGLQYLERVA